MAYLWAIYPKEISEPVIGLRQKNDFSLRRYVRFLGKLASYFFGLYAMNNSLYQ